MSSHHGRRHREALEKVEREREYEPAQAVALVKGLAKAKFDESVELHVRTGLNVRHADEQLRGTIALPNGLGKDVKIIVFAQGPKVAEAEAAGADAVGGEDLAKRIEEGFDDFDVAIATPDLMSVVARTRARAVGQDAKPEGGHGDDGCRQSRRRVQVGQGGVPHRPQRDRAHGDRQGELRRAPAGELRRGDRRAGSRQAGEHEKGRYLHSITLTSTMGPGVKVDAGRTRDILEEAPAATIAAKYYPKTPRSTSQLPLGLEQRGFRIDIQSISSRQPKTPGGDRFFAEARDRSQQ